MCELMTVYNCGTQYSTEVLTILNLPSYPPDNHHSSDNVYCSRGEEI